MTEPPDEVGIYILAWIHPCLGKWKPELLFEMLELGWGWGGQGSNCWGSGDRKLLRQQEELPKGAGGP